MPFRPSLAVATLLLLAACGDPDTNDSAPIPQEPDMAGPDTPTPDPEPEPVLDTFDPREAGVRAPITSSCDPIDAARCLLPWPSDAFVAAADTPTGLRVQLDPEVIPEHDNAKSTLRADGFSRATPIVTTFPVAIDPGALPTGPGTVQVIVSEPGPLLGQRVPMLFDVQTETFDDDSTESTIVGYPLRPYAAQSEHVVIVHDQTLPIDGVLLTQERLTAVALGLAEPTTNEEAAHFAYHAPSRAAIRAADVDFERIVRLWSFTTRSLENPLKDVNQARALTLSAVENGAVGVVLEDVSVAPFAEAALLVRGHLTGVPNILTDREGLFRDAQNAVASEGVREVPFRVVVPVGEGDYRIVMYGHGMGGDVTDPAFDRVISGAGAAKIGTEFTGWSERTLPITASHFQRALAGSDHTAAGLVSSVAGAMAVQHMLSRALGDVLSAPAIDGQDNPASGRRPILERAVWAGGSMGGTVGMIYASAEPGIETAVLNVPGAGFTHFLRFSNLFPVLRLIFEAQYTTSADVSLAIAMAQISMDAVDGVAWGDALEDPPVLLIQQSIGDPVLPNIGSNLLAASVGAAHLER